MGKYVIANKTQPINLTHTLLYILIQTEQIKIENEYLDTEFDSLSKEEKTFENMRRLCRVGGVMQT